MFVCLFVYSIYLFIFFFLYLKDMLKELELAQKKELNSIIQFGEDIFNDPSMSSEDHRRIKQEIGSLKSNLENLEEKMKWRAKR